MLGFKLCARGDFARNKNVAEWFARFAEES